MDSVLAGKEYALETQVSAARKVERCWCQFRDKQMYRLLKHAICTAEHSLTFEILRKVVPKEAELLKDPFFKAKIRFRFAGAEFPPFIVFKIFLKTEGQGVKYLSGKRTIKPTSEAAADSCRIMGNRKFYEQLISDQCQHEQDRISDVIDVTNMKEYMKYLTNLDELPASLGGRDNTWRRLTLQILPRHNVVYDIVNYMETGQSSRLLEEEFPVARTRLSTPARQSHYLSYLAKSRKTTPLQSLKESISERRSHKAQKRVEKMRKLYGLDRRKEDDEGVNFEADDWDKEGQMLFEWTQELPLNAKIA